MTNDKRNWKITISIDGIGNRSNYVYGVTYSDAYASAQRQIEGDKRVLGFVVSEA